MKQLHQYCKQQKEHAMKLYDSKNSRTRYNAGIAINAWDELLGQLHKHTNLTPKRFEKTKATALKLASHMTNGKYKSNTIQNIQNVKL